MHSANFPQITRRKRRAEIITNNLIPIPHPFPNSVHVAPLPCVDYLDLALAILVV